MKARHANSVDDVLVALAKIRDLDASHARSLPTEYYASEAFPAQFPEILRKYKIRLASFVTGQIHSHEFL